MNKKDNKDENSKIYDISKKRKDSDNDTKKKVHYGRYTMRIPKGVLIAAIIVILIVVGIVADIESGGALAAVNGQVVSFFTKSTTNNFSVNVDGNEVKNFKQYGSGYTILTESGISYISASGNLSSKQQIAYGSSSLAVSGKRALIFDRGGTSFLLEQNGSIFSKLETTGKIIDADIGKKKNCAVAVSTSDGKSALYGYDNSGTVVYQWICADGYITDVEMCPSGNKAFVTVINSKNAVLGASLYFLNFGYESEYSSFEYSGEVVMGVNAVSESKAVVVTDSNVYLVSGKEQEKIYNYDSSDIFYYDMSDSGTTAVVTTDYKSDTSYNLTMFGKNGKQLFSVAATGKVRGVSVDKKTVSVLYSDKVEIFSKKGKAVGMVDDIDYADDIVLNGNYVYVLTSDCVKKYSSYGNTSHILSEDATQ